MKNLYRQILLIVLILSSFTVQILAYECPDFDEFDRKVQAAIDVLKESNATENEAKRLLVSLQNDILTDVALRRAWTYLHETLGGGNWAGVATAARSAGLIIGEINDSKCIEAYNELRHPKTIIDDKDSTKFIIIEILDSIMTNTAEMDSIAVSGVLNNLEKVIADEVPGPEGYLGQTLYWLSLVVPVLILTTLIYFIKSTMHKLSRIRDRLVALDNQGDSLILSISKVNKSIEDIESGFSTLKKGVSDTQSNTPAIKADSGQLTLVKQELGKIKEMLMTLTLQQEKEPEASTPPKAESPKPLPTEPQESAPKEPEVVQVLYANSAINNEFKRTLRHEDQDAIFKIEVLEGKQRAFFSVIEKPIIMQRAINEHDIVLAGACRYQNGRPSGKAMRVINIEKGMLKPSLSQGWQIEKKAIIDFS